MGNSIARDFHQVALADHGSTSGLKQNELISAVSQVLERPMTILVRRDPQRKSVIFFDQETMLPLYVMSTDPHRQQRGIESVTKDRNGQVLFFTAPSEASKSKKLIYRPTHDMMRSCSSDMMRSCSDASSTSSSRSSSSSSSSSSDNLPCAAQIELDRSGPAVVAFLNVVVWSGCGPSLLSVYKAVKIEAVKYGALIADMEGHAVGKVRLDEARMQPVIDVAAGADVPSIISLAAALFHNFR